MQRLERASPRKDLPKKSEERRDVGEKAWRGGEEGDEKDNAKKALDDDTVLLMPSMEVSGAMMVVEWLL